MSGNQEAFQKAMNQGNSSAWDQAWEQASRYYRLALEEFPDNVQALTNLGLALLEMREYNDALQYYQKAAKLAPEDPVPVDKMARIFERQGRVDLAVRASIQAAELFLRARDVEKAIQNWNQVLSMQPENIPARSRLATVYEKTGRKAEAVTQYLAMASILQSAGDRAKAAHAALAPAPGLRIGGVLRPFAVVPARQQRWSSRQRSSTPRISRRGSI